MIKGKLQKFVFWLLGIQAPQYVCKVISRDIAMATSIGHKDTFNGSEAEVIDVIKLFGRHNTYLVVLDTTPGKVEVDG